MRNLAFLGLFSLSTFSFFCFANKPPIPDDTSYQSWSYTDTIAIPNSITGKVGLRSPTADIQIYELLPPVGKPIVGDFIFLHGFADRAMNHLALFEQYLSLGFRVLSFDYPSHGKSTGDFIGRFGIKGLAYLAAQVERRAGNRPVPSRPLILGGWSTGGLVGIRMIQEPNNYAQFTRPISGASFFAPGVGVKLLPGRLGFVTLSTLVHDEVLPNAGQITKPSPLTPFFHPFFAFKLLRESSLAFKQSLPSNIPIQIFLAKPEDDKYVDSLKVEAWVTRQIEEAKARVSLIEVNGAFHGLDLESATFGGQEVRRLSSEFAASVAERGIENVPGRRVFFHARNQQYRAPCRLSLNRLLSF